MNLLQWARDWNVPMVAIEDLRRRMGMEGGAHALVPAPLPGGRGERVRVSEAAVQAAVRLEAAKKDVRLWRNNVGALLDSRGVPVRYGLANDSAEMNKIVKSADLIGVRPVLITEAHVGGTIGQFVSRECKKVGWTYTGDAHEQAQLNWANMVIAAGGDAGFATGEGSL